MTTSQPLTSPAPARRTPPATAVVARRRHLPGLPALVRRRRRRRHRRPARHHRRLPYLRRARRRRAVAVAVLPLAAGRRGLRRRRLPRRRPGLRHPGRRRRPHRARRTSAGLRVVVDLVPNHSSDEHAWFQAALAAGPGSPERDRYMFRDGSGPDGDAAAERLAARSSAAPPGPGSPSPTAPPASGTCTCSTPSSPTSTGEPRGARGVPRHPAVLARPRRRRLPGRRRARPGQGGGPARLGHEHEACSTTTPTARPPPPDVGPGRRARRSTGVAPDPRRLRRRPDDGRRGVGRAGRAPRAATCAPTSCTRRSTSATSRRPWRASTSAR